MQPPGGKYRYEEIVTRMLTQLREEGRLTDVNPGSVVRTLVEAFGRELAEAHARLSHIYEMGYIDTATGESLDFLVALLGQRRIDGLQVVGDAVFTRDSRVAGRVVIPEGTRLKVQLQPSGLAYYRTSREAELEPGQNSVTVPVVADPAEGEEPTAHLLPDELDWQVVQDVPLAGIGGVDIPRPTVQRGYRESDDDLRRRVKGLIDAAGGGTLKAMERAILATGHAAGVVFRDADSDGLPRLQPGQLEVVVDGDLAAPNAYSEIRDAINRTKGPGILVSIRGITTRTVTIQLRVLPSTPNLSAGKKQALRRAIEQTVQGAIVGLKVGEKLLWNPVQAKVLSLDGVRDILEGTATLDGSPMSLTREIPSGPLSPLERLTVPEDGPAVTILFDGEATVQLRLWASVEPDPTTRAAIARAVEEVLAGKNDLAGPAAISFAEVVAAAKGAPGGAILEGATVAVQVIDLLGGGEAFLSPAFPTYNLGPSDRLEPHPDGPVWGELP
ncbi:MAG: baseplate J/gp47 family protein [Bacillota bacterium]